MDIKVYDNVGKMSVYLKLKLEELDKLQKEKEDILRTIEELESRGELEDKYPEIKTRMANNIRAFEDVVSDIKRLNSVDVEGRK